MVNSPWRRQAGGSVTQLPAEAPPQAPPACPFQSGWPVGPSEGCLGEFSQQSLLGQTVVWWEGGQAGPSFPRSFFVTPCHLCCFPVASLCLVDSEAPSASQSAFVTL